MMLKRNAEGRLVLVINAHRSATPIYEVEPDVIPGIGPCLHFYHVSNGEVEGRRLLMTLSRNGAISMMRFLPSLVNEAGRMQYRESRRQRL
jgi:hypothetical protein